MSALEWGGFAAGAISVWLAVRLSVWTWPIGIVNSACWLFLFGQSRLYMNAGLQILYILLSLLGWYWWLHRGDARSTLSVSKTTFKQACFLVSIALLGTGAIWWAQVNFTDSAAPFADSATTVASLIAQWMLMRKLIGTWYLWIAVDVAYVVLYSQQKLWLTAGLQILFIAMCSRGLIEWRRELGKGALARDSLRDAGPDPIPALGHVLKDNGAR